MIEVFGDIWSYYDSNRSDFVCITTNGCVKHDGSLVMGRGIAAQAKSLFPGIDYVMGERVKRFGNHVHFYYNIERKTIQRRRFYNLISFPTKFDDYRANSDIVLIKKSAEELNEAALKFPTEIFILPRPGCSNGGLNWEDVKPVIDFLPDNVLVIDRRADNVSSNV